MRKKLIPLTERELGLVNDNQRIVNIVTNKFIGIPNEDREDLRSYLQFSLCRAAQRFSVERASPEAFFTATLKGEAKHYFRDYIWRVRPPRVYRDCSISTIVLKQPEDSNADDLSNAYNKLYTAASPIPFHNVHEEDLSTENFADSVIDDITLNDLIRDLINAFPEVEKEIVALIIKYEGPTHAFVLDWISRTFKATISESRRIALSTQKRLQDVYTSIVNGGIPVKISSPNPYIHKVICRRLSELISE